jgi:hypothetical protein
MNSTTTILLNFCRFGLVLRPVTATGKERGGKYAKAAAATEKRLAKILKHPMHQWFTGEMSEQESYLESEPPKTLRSVMHNRTASLRRFI